MSDMFSSGGMDERRVRIAKIGGSALAFAALVAWMTPPTTPRVIPSPLLAYKNVRSDAPTRDPAFGMSGPAYPNTPAIPWWALRTPPAVEPTTVVTYQAAEAQTDPAWQEDDDADQPSYVTQEHSVDEARPTDADIAYQAERAAWAAAMRREGVSVDDRYEEGD